MEIPQEAIAHAVECYPNESCGLIVGGQYIACRNIATNPGEHFVMHTGDYRLAMDRGDIEAMVHSHPDHTCQPSEADRAVCEESELPSLILEIREGKFVDSKWLRPTGWQAPLLGRPFAHGIHDCLSIILDYYKRERGIDLGDYERRDNWWNEGGDLYREHLPRAGFYRLRDGEQPQTGDVILMQVRAPVPNHAGIYIEDGMLTTEPVAHPVPQCILHHMYGRSSKRDVYGGYYQEKTVGIWRYGADKMHSPVR